MRWDLSVTGFPASAEITSYTDEWENSPPDHDAFATGHAGIHPVVGIQQVITKIPPAFDGRSSWFAYEEAIDDWCDVTELDADKRDLLSGID